MNIMKIGTVSALVVAAVVAAGSYRNNNSARQTTQQIALTANPGKNLTIKDYSKYGVEIHHMGDPRFHQEAEYMFHAPPEIKDAIKRYSIVVVNNSTQPIVGLRLIWTSTLPDGKPTSAGQSFTHMHELFRAPITEGVIMPGKKFAYSLIRQASKKNRIASETNGIIEIEDSDNVRAMINRFNESTMRSNNWTVELGGALFADGVFIGKDNMYFDFVTGQINGARDLVKEMAQKVENGQSGQSLSAHLNQYSQVTEDQLLAPFKNRGQAMTDPHFSYNHSKTNMAKELEGKMKRGGDTELVATIQRYGQNQIMIARKTD
jgi:hypothetical protein